MCVCQLVCVCASSCVWPDVSVCKRPVQPGAVEASSKTKRFTHKAVAVKALSALNGEGLGLQ